MSVSLRWVIVVVAAALVVGLLIWARGHDHHRGTEVGSLAAPAGVSARAG